ncbi:MAG: AAA family ATPase [Desulfobacterales bacterium]
MNAKATRVIAIANEKGGVGKTVTVINLGAALVRDGKQVLIIDMDPQANATKGVGFQMQEEQLSIYDLLKEPEKHKIDDLIIPTQWEGLYLIPSHVDLSGAEVELVDEEGRENRLREVCENLSKNFDYILLDTPPSLSLLTINVLTYAGEVLVPCQTQPYAYAALEDLFDTIEAVNEEINPNLHVSGIVATFFDKRTRVSQNILDKLKESEKYRRLLFDTVVRTNTTIAESAEVGKPVVFYRSGSYGAKDYSKLARELMNRDAGAF